MNDPELRFDRLETAELAVSRKIGRKEGSEGRNADTVAAPNPIGVKGLSHVVVVFEKSLSVLLNLAWIAQVTEFNEAGWRCSIRSLAEG